MDRFEWAKIPTAICGAVLLVCVAQFFGFAFYEQNADRLKLVGVTTW